MEEVYKLIIGICVLALGIPIGNLLARATKEELKEGKRWFILLILICIIGAVFGLVYKNDVLLFTLLFIAVVTSRSLKYTFKKKNKKRK